MRLFASLGERWRSLSQKQLRWLLLSSSVLHGIVAIYVVVALPIISLRPLCRDGDINYDTPRRWIEGRFASAYFDAFERRFLPHMTTYENSEHVLYVTIAQSLDWTNIEKHSDLALHDVLRARLGREAYQDLIRRRTAIPGLDDGIYADCVTMRKFASADGEWRNSGPEPVPVQ
jgi:hypothetical protein